MALTRPMGRRVVGHMRKGSNGPPCLSSLGLWSRVHAGEGLLENNWEDKIGVGRRLCARLAPGRAMLELAALAESGGAAGRARSWGAGMRGATVVVCLLCKNIDPVFVLGDSLASKIDIYILTLAFGSLIFAECNLTSIHTTKFRDLHLACDRIHVLGRTDPPCRWN